ncbi:hypothetical protein NOH45_002769 [Salmonella enterica]|nr:hypothetical protein [Salmonella enterica]
MCPVTPTVTTSYDVLSIIYDYEQEPETVFKNKETEKEKMLKLAKELLLSVMEKFMAEILDSLVEASEPSDGVIRVITGNNLPVAK